MRFLVKAIDEDSATQISTWTYAYPYDLYNFGPGYETTQALLSGTYFRVMDGEVLAGYGCHGEDARVPAGVALGAYPEIGCIDVGLGMRPDITGHGFGKQFVATILPFLETEYGIDRVRLTVATFNARAIRVYESLGFSPILRFARESTEFITMVRPAGVSPEPHS